MTDAPEVAGFEFFAACPRHVSELLASELREAGLNVTREHPAGVSFNGPLRDGYVACLHSRTASRVLLTLATVPLDTVEAMHAALLEIPWEEHLAPQGTLAVDVVGEAPAWLRHTQFAAQKTKDAIVDRFRAAHGRAAIGGPAGTGPACEPASRAHARDGLGGSRRRAVAPSRLSAVGRRGAAQGKPGGGAAAALRLASDRGGRAARSSTRCAARARWWWRRR